MASEEKAGERARELLHGGIEGERVADDPAGAERAARRILEDSEARTLDPATTDPTDEGVIRRDSEETAASGD